ncbi:hypothetical protein [Kitasatospora aureofaciens]|uniref:hypothetical protein n=1 Tax=Kitasatospora aureofaciens TaxID=1894 RepID=UPI001C46B52A|nr:hypothetical protein [Kitasatospora aureofaciens]MBV6701453.1 hypothetical protein [Kitasatospora aureofaciens]
MPELSPAEEGGKDERKRIDLSVAQVAASALAAVVGAVLASELGVYGSILGAAVVSVGATTGGAVFQHIFRRTGEQLRDAVDRGPGQTVNGLRQVPTDPVGPSVISSEWNEPQVVRARRRWTWRTYAAVSGLVFVLAMTPIVAFELATGQPVSATVTGTSGSGTSLGGTVSPRSTPPAEEPAGRPSGGGHEPGGLPSDGASAAATTKPRPEPSTSPSSGTGDQGGTASPSAKPSPDPSPSGSATPTSGVSPSAGGGQPTGGSTSQSPDPSQAPASVAPQPPAQTPAG